MIESDKKNRTFVSRLAPFFEGNVKFYGNTTVYVTFFPTKAKWVIKI